MFLEIASKMSTPGESRSRTSPVRRLPIEPDAAGATPSLARCGGRRNYAFKANTDEGNKLAPIADSWKEIADRYRAQWITPGIQSRHRNRQVMA